MSRPSVTESRLSEVPSTLGVFASPPSSRSPVHRAGARKPTTSKHPSGHTLSGLFSFSPVALSATGVDVRCPSPPLHAVTRTHLSGSERTKGGQGSQRLLRVRRALISEPEMRIASPSGHAPRPSPARQRLSHCVPLTSENVAVTFVSRMPCASEPFRAFGWFDRQIQEVLAQLGPCPWSHRGRRPRLALAPPPLAGAASPYGPSTLWRRGRPHARAACPLGQAWSARATSRPPPGLPHGHGGDLGVIGPSRQDLENPILHQGRHPLGRGLL